MDEENFYTKLLKGMPKRIEEILELSKNQTIHSETEIRDTINNFFEKIKINLEEEEKKFVDTVLSNLPEGQLALKMKEEDDNPHIKVQDKLKSLMANLEKMIEVASVNEEIINKIKNAPLEGLLRINSAENRLEFRPLVINKNRLYGKLSFEYKWDESLSNKNGRGKVSEEGKVLTINSNSCWNFFATKESFKEGSLKFTIQVDNLSSDNHFYIGMVNSEKDLKASSGCLCCANPNSWYYDRAGVVAENNILSKGKIETRGRKTFKAQVEADLDDKKVSYLEEGDKSGPYTLKGSEFRFLVACCNSTTATVTILDYEIS